MPADRHDEQVDKEKVTSPVGRRWRRWNLAAAAHMTCSRACAATQTAGLARLAGSAAGHVVAGA
jgi:hypothetical protein